jgi:hypothetical protein
VLGAVIGPRIFFSVERQEERRLHSVMVPKQAQKCRTNNLGGKKS